MSDNARCSRAVHLAGNAAPRTCLICTLGPCRFTVIPLVPTLEERLALAQIGSCTCNTKAPQVAHHNPMCSYRLFGEALEAIHE